MKLRMLLVLFLHVALEELVAISTRQECPPFGRVKYGRVKYRSQRKIARFRCRRKYTLHGAKMAVCLQGKWSHPAPVCIMSGCEELDPGPNQVMTTLKSGALLEFECQESYLLEGNSRLYCNGKIWNDTMPTCRYVEPSMECSFETSDLCDWTQNQDDDFDWIYHSGRTSTDKTGPEADHTYNNITGHYLYIESSMPRTPGHKAIITSPSYRELPNGTCFGFYYHMKGLDGDNEVGTLDVYIRRNHEDISDLQPVFSRTGYQGDDWIRGRVEIGNTSSVIQVVISAIRGNSYIGDISIDDVRFYQCSDDEELTTEGLTTDSQENNVTSPVLDTTTVKFDGDITTEILPSNATTAQTYQMSTDEQTTKQQLDLTTQTVVSTTLTSSNPSTSTVSSETAGTTEKVTQETTMSTTKSTEFIPVTTATPHPSSSTTMVTKKSTTTQQTTTPTTTQAKTTKKVVTTPSTTTRTTSPTTTTPTTTPTTTKLTTSKTTMKITTSSTAVPTTFTTRIETSTTSTSETLTTTDTSTTQIPTTTASSSSTTTSYTTPKTTTHQGSTRSSVSSKSMKQTTSQSTTTATKTTTDWDNSIAETTKTSQQNNKTDIPNIIPISQESKESKGPVKPLMIGVGVGVAIGLAIVLVIVFIYIKRNRKKKQDEMEDEMAPIARNAYSEW